MAVYIIKSKVGYNKMQISTVIYKYITLLVRQVNAQTDAHTDRWTFLRDGFAYIIWHVIRMYPRTTFSSIEKIYILQYNTLIKNEYNTLPSGFFISTALVACTPPTWINNIEKQLYNINNHNINNRHPYRYIRKNIKF